MKMKKINCTTTDDLQFALSVLISFWHDWPTKCCTLIEINVIPSSTIVLITCPVYKYYVVQSEFVPVWPSFISNLRGREQYIVIVGVFHQECLE